MTAAGQVPGVVVLTALAVGALAFAAILWRERRQARERVARACHEVRGPLSATQLALHAAARRADIAPTFLAGLELEVRRAALALDDLQGHPAGPADQVDLDALLSAQVATWREVARAHGAEVVLDRGDEATVVRGDAVRLAQALGNVLANAIEHGGGVVTVRAVAAGRRVRVEVGDGGPGLPAPVAELVRGPRTGRAVRGRGLAIAADATARHGGRLLVAPSPRGACVALDLPIAGGTATL